MTLDSRSLNELNTAELCFEMPSIYSSSDTDESIDPWIQRPISYLDLDPEGALLNGLYVQSSFLEVIPTVKPDLAFEFEAWEELSDEALILFEAECS
jgi:hypothetical protein